MTTPTKANPLQTITNQAAISIAEAQFRLANLFTPYMHQPERIDFDRVAVYLHDNSKAFPSPTEGIKNALVRINAVLDSQLPLLEAMKAQGIEPSLDADQLFMTAKANVTNPAMARAA